MDMQRDTTRRAAHANRGIEQRRRIESAAERDRHARIGGQRRKRRADRIENEAGGGGVGRSGHGGGGGGAFRKGGRLFPPPPFPLLFPPRPALGKTRALGPGTSYPPPPPPLRRH